MLQIGVSIVGILVSAIGIYLGVAATQDLPPFGDTAPPPTATSIVSTPRPSMATPTPTFSPEAKVSAQQHLASFNLGRNFALATVPQLIGDSLHEYDALIKRDLAILQINIKYPPEDLIRGDVEHNLNVVELIQAELIGNLISRNSSLLLWYEYGLFYSARIGAITMISFDIEAGIPINSIPIANHFTETENVKIDLLEEDLQLQPYFVERSNEIREELSALGRPKNVIDRDAVNELLAEIESYLDDVGSWLNDATIQ